MRIVSKSLFFLIQAKREIYSVKQERLAIAEDEVGHLCDSLARWKASVTSCEYYSLTGRKNPTFYIILYYKNHNSFD